MSARPYLGYRPGDADTPYGRWFRPDMAPLASHVTDAVTLGPQPEPLLTDLADLAAFLGGDEPTENGYAVCRDGSIRVAVLTPMPGVTPDMWDWWFGWHGCDARRYKLWHPRAHLSASWADGDNAGGGRDAARGRDRYVGRTSVVVEYLGSTLRKAAISFVEPSSMGLDARALADPTKATAICARLGDASRPVDVGHLVHHVRATADGSEMRSRFWLGGAHIATRGTSGPLAGVADRAVAPLASRLLAPSPQSAADLLVHCAQEMSHLASFLPDLHEEFGST